MPLQPKSWQQTLQELWELLRAYAAQETFGPLANLKRQVSFGLAGSLLFSLGIFLLALSAMRFMQTHIAWTMEHNWSAYLAGMAILVITVAVCAFKIKGKPSAAEQQAAVASITGSTPDIATVAENGTLR